MSLAEPVAQSENWGADAQPAAQLPPDGGTQTAAQTTAEPVAAPVAGAEGEKASRKGEKHAKPVYELKQVGASLPELPKRDTSNLVGGKTREDRFRDDLVAIKAPDAIGSWFEIADYGATTTAKRTAAFLTEAVNPQVSKTLEDGTVEQVGGELLDLVDAGYKYEFVGQRSDSDSKRSKLYARYVAV